MSTKDFIPKGFERLEHYAARHKLDIVKLTVLWERRELYLKRWKIGPDCWVLLISKKTEPPEAALPAPGRKPCELEPYTESYELAMEGFNPEDQKAYDFASLTKELGMESTKECRTWLRSLMGPAANLIRENRDMGKDKYELLLNIGRVQVSARA